MPPKAVTLDRYGDTQLRIGLDHSEEPVVFTACSRALSRSSSIFRSMLYGDTVGNEPGIISRRENQIIDVRHDTLVPMTTLLCIIHSKFDQVPPELSVDELYDLVVVARKYDMMTALRPWTAKWTKILGTNTQSTQEEITKALWIYWELRQRDAFYLAARRLTVESRAPVNSCPDGLRTPPGIAGEYQELTALRFLVLSPAHV
ncbi:hypothetical protein MANI_021980 [Metarhizium anisopliae]